MSISLALVEDISEVRDAVKEYICLNSDFRLCGVFATGEEAVRRLPLLDPDIVIMDITLPGITGIECIKLLKSKIPRAQFMMFTVYENDERVFEALRAGASGYLLKNSGLAQLESAIRDLHNGGSPMSSNIARKLVTLFQNEHPEKAEDTLLSKRENEILQLLSKGLLYKEIADQIGVTTGTVRQYIHKIYEKLHVQNRTEAINKALGRG